MTGLNGYRLGLTRLNDWAKWLFLFHFVALVGAVWAYGKYCAVAGVSSDEYIWWWKWKFSHVDFEKDGTRLPVALLFSVGEDLMRGHEIRCMSVIRGT